MPYLFNNYLETHLQKESLQGKLYTNAQQFEAYLFENDCKVLIPEGFLVLSALLILMYAVFYSGRKQEKYPLLMRNSSVLALLSIFFTLVLLIQNPLQKGILFYNSFVVDEFTLFCKLLICVGAFFSLLISLDYIQQESLNRFEYIVLLLLSTSSMLFLVSASDFISIYLAIELQSLCFYVLTAFKRDSELSTEAGLKYFILGAFSSGVLLFGFSLIYGFTGVTHLSELAHIFLCDGERLSYEISSLRGCELGMIFILVAFLFKLTAVPFHMWAPDVYEGAPSSVTAFFSIVPKVSLFALFCRLFFQGFYDLMAPWQHILVFSSIASMLLGSIAALSQNKIKRLLAFSSIGHVGYMLIAFCCGTVEGIQALLIYLVMYIVMTITLFAIVLSPLRREGTQLVHPGVSQVQRVKYTTDLAMLSQSNPLLAFTLTITMFSLAGIPPLAGFYSKAFLIFAAVSSSQYIIALIALLTSVWSCFYYIRIVKIMYFESPNRYLAFMQISKETSIALGCMFCFLILFFVYPAPLFVISHKIALHLCY